MNLVLVPAGNESKYEQAFSVKNIIYERTGLLTQNRSFFRKLYKNSQVHLYEESERVHGFGIIDIQMYRHKRSPQLRLPGSLSLFLSHEEIVKDTPLVAEGYLSLLGVRPSMSRQGIASEILTEAKGHYEDIFCHVRASNEGALSFYKSQDFELRRMNPQYYSDSEDAAYLHWRSDEEESKET